MNSAELQQAIYDRLNSVTAITDAVTGIYTKVPQAVASGDDTVFPFISISPITATNFDTKTEDGLNSLFDVHLWSRSTSALVWRAIGDDIYAALQKFDLVITGVNTVACRFEDRTEFDDPDGKTTHTILSFRVTYFIV